MWNDDYALSQKAEPYQDIIYKQLFPVKNIERFNKGIEPNILDTKYHIDVQIKTTNFTTFLGQEKALRHEWAKYNTFTIEFYQNRFTKELGEFFNLGAQFYLHAYWNKEYNGFQKWYLIKIFDFLQWLNDKPISELEKNTRGV